MGLFDFITNNIPGLSDIKDQASEALGPVTEDVTAITDSVTEVTNGLGEQASGVTDAATEAKDNILGGIGGSSENK